MPIGSMGCGGKRRLLGPSLETGRGLSPVEHPEAVQGLRGIQKLPPQAYETPLGGENGTFTDFLYLLSQQSLEL